jgi:hypothetical protein
VLSEKSLDSIKCGYEGHREIRIWSTANDDQKPDSVANHRIFLVRSVTNAAVVRNGDPTALPDFC